MFCESTTCNGASCKNTYCKDTTGENTYRKNSFSDSTTFPVKSWHNNVEDKGPCDALDHTTRLCWQAPGTCGEFIQGAINGCDFLVNCPIDRYSRATLMPSTSSEYHIQNAEEFGKIQHALDLLGQPEGITGYQIRVTSDVPRGKGMASSSADLAAALTAVNEHISQKLSAIELTRLIARVEPSDCVHLPGIGHVNHLNGDIFACLPPPCNLGVIVFDSGGEINTIEFDRDHARAVYKAEQPTVIAMLMQLRRGLLHGNLTDIATAATTSARLSQRILPKPNFESLIQFVTDHGALGVNCAHSGTVLGVLFEIGNGLGDSLLQKIRSRFGSAFEVLGTHNIISGGCS